MHMSSIVVNRYSVVLLESVWHFEQTFQFPILARIVTEVPEDGACVIELLDSQGGGVRLLVSEFSSILLVAAFKSYMEGG